MKTSAANYDNGSAGKSNRYNYVEDNEGGSIAEGRVQILQRKIELLEKENTNLQLENEIYRDKSEFYKNKLKTMEDENLHLSQVIEALQLQANQSKILTHSMIEKNETSAPQNQSYMHNNQETHTQAEAPPTKNEAPIPDKDMI